MFVKFELTMAIKEAIEKAEKLNQSNILLSANIIKMNQLLCEKKPERVDRHLEARKTLNKKIDERITKILLQEINGIIVCLPSKEIALSPFMLDGAYIFASSNIIYLSPLNSDVLVDRLLNWLNQKSITLTTIAIFHYNLVKIHPFHDGNGRTARLFSTFLLRQCGYSFDSGYALEKYFETNKSAYYRALRLHPDSKQCEFYSDGDERDITSWVEYFCVSFVSALEQHNQNHTDKL